MSNNVNPDTNCIGCDMHCEFGYFKFGHNGNIYPTLNHQVVTNYWTSRCEHKFISPSEIRTATQAIALARDIARHCNHYQEKQH